MLKSRPIVCHFRPNAMPYMLMMIEPVGQRATRTEAEGREAYDLMTRWGDDLKARGLLLASESLQGTADGARVQVRAGRTHIVDGPFAEAKEMVGGFFLVDCTTRDDALALATQCPAAAWCTVEVRAVAPCYEDG
jgi:hypothetical protein